MNGSDASVPFIEDRSAKSRLLRETLFACVWGCVMIVSSPIEFEFGEYNWSFSNVCDDLIYLFN